MLACSKEGEEVVKEPVGEEIMGEVAVRKKTAKMVTVDDA